MASRDRIDLVELARYEILLPPKGTAFRDEIDADARRARVKLRTRAEVDGLRLLASLAFSGFAPALLPASATHGASSDGWRSVPVDQLGARSVGLARSRRTAPAAPPRAVAEIIRGIVRAEAANQPHIHLAETPAAPAPPPPSTRPSTRR